MKIDPKESLPYSLRVRRVASKDAINQLMRMIGVALISVKIMSEPLLDDYNSMKQRKGKMSLILFLVV